MLEQLNIRRNSIFERLIQHGYRFDQLDLDELMFCVQLNISQTLVEIDRRT